MTKREVMQRALDALESALSDDQPYITKCVESAAALRAELAKPEPEPAYWLVKNGENFPLYRKEDL